MNESRTYQFNFSDAGFCFEELCSPKQRRRSWPEIKASFDNDLPGNASPRWATALDDQSHLFGTAKVHSLRLRSPSLLKSGPRTETMTTLRRRFSRSKNSTQKLGIELLTLSASLKRARRRTSRTHGPTSTTMFQMDMAP